MRQPWAKSKLGLADYEVRYFHAWHRHMALCLLAHSFLPFADTSSAKKTHLPLFACLSLAECQVLFNLFFPLPTPSFKDKLHWFGWRRLARFRALASRYGLAGTDLIHQSQWAIS